MSTLRSNLIEPLSGTTVTLGASGDAVTVPTGATLKSNTFKDAGGNTLFTSNGSGVVSGANIALTDNLVLISSQSASNSASVEFTSGIDSTYGIYVFHIVNYDLATNAQEFGVQFSINNGTSYGVTKTSTFASSHHNEANSVLELENRPSSDRAQSTSFQHLDVGNETNADSSGVGCLKLWNPSSTVYVKHFNYTGNNHRHSNATFGSYVAGYLNTRSPINAVKFVSASGNITAGNFYMYGIK